MSDADRLRFGSYLAEIFSALGMDLGTEGTRAKLTRLVRIYAGRFTVQERLGEQIADGLLDLVDARGVAVLLEATHLCTQMRGVAEDSSRTRTTFWRGLYDVDRDLRREFLDLSAH